MKWFEGPIPEAVNSSKQKGVIFVVYIYGNDELSSQMNTSWDDEQVSKSLEDCGAVAIRILNTSEECKFFSQIYPVVCVPSTFFIGEAGVPLEVTGGHMSPDEFKKKIELVLKTHESQKQQKASSSEISPKPPPTEESSAGTVALTEPAAEPMIQASTSQGSQAVASDGSEKSLSEKVERAKELIEKKREEKAKADFEKSRNQEIERRKFGSDLQKLKEKQAEMEMKELKEQMKKEKEESRKAKEKIRQQIEQDREERKARYNKEKEEKEKAQEDIKRARLQEQQRKAAEEEAARSDTARILVRLPDGSSMSTRFSSSETLQCLHDAVTQRLGGSVVLSTTFPKRQFTADDMNSTFSELQLAPTASVIALPAARAARSVVQASSSGSLLQTLLYPLIFVWNFLYSMFFGAGVSSSSSSSQQRGEPMEQTQSQMNRPTSAYQRRTHASRQDGKITRLTDVRDDDDDMSTYNGNTTQQM